MIWPYGWFDEYMYRDLVREKRIISYSLRKPCQSPILNFIRRVHQSYKINRIIPLPGQEIWYASLFDLLDADTCVLFNTGALSMVSMKFLNRIRDAGARMVLIAADSLHGPSKHLPKAISNILGFSWDAVLSYDRYDCEEYGFLPLDGTIYSLQDGVEPSPDGCDLYFVGANKAGRNEIVAQIHERCIAAGVRTDFNCIDYPGNPRKSYGGNGEGIRFWKREIPYEEVLGHVLSANCILEVVGKGQKVQTARYYEAVCYNKKLLTNNPSVKDLSFYDSRYMRYFETVDDIDVSWVKEKVPIDYHYAGEFSPLHILDKLDSMFAKS